MILSPPKLLIVCGPTGVGKTQLAVSFAKKFGGELVSADSRQVYREMDIGTGKDRDEIGDMPIWMYDVVSPNEEFSVSQYVKMAQDIIADIHKRRKLPIVVGGTGLYINALIHPPETIHIPPDKALRERLQSMTIRELHHMVVRGDMNESDWHNPRRLIRKIEIQKAGTYDKPRHVVFDACIVGLAAPMRVLEERINKRVSSRLVQGMKRETETLIKKYGSSAPGLHAIGYKSPETWAHDERAYAKRQMTYFRKLPGITWFDATERNFETQVTAHVSAWYTQRNT